MTLEEAKKKLREWIKCEKVTIRTEEGDIEIYQERLELFEFVLNYIENESIPKEKVREKIEELKVLSDNGANAVRFAMSKEDEIERVQIKKDIDTMLNILQELLGE